MYKMRIWICTLGMLSMLAYIHVTLWELIRGRQIGIDRALYILLPGYQLTTGGFIIGLVESFLWGAYVAVFFVIIHNYFYGIHHVSPEDKGTIKQAA